MSSSFRADLHCHTTASDGTVEPAELVLLAKKLGLQGLSISDHDTMEAYQDALPAAREAGIRLLPGVEFSCVHADSSVHLLAYAFPFDSLLIRDFCEQHRQRRRRRAEMILERLSEHDVFLTEDDLDPIHRGGMVGRPHIAEAMVRKGVVPYARAAFQRYLSEGCCAFVPSMSCSAEETISLIHRARGLAVIAHPMLIKKNRIYRDLLELPVDGIEGYYACCTADQERPYQQVAKQRGLLVTGGSDFHGKAKPRISLGCSWTPQDTFETLWEHYQKVSQ